MIRLSVFLIGMFKKMRTDSIRLGVGSIRFPTMKNNSDILDFIAVNSILEMARKQNIKFIDTSYSYMHGQCEVAIGIALQHDRKNWKISTRINPRIIQNRSLTELLSEQLERLNTDYIDYYGYHAINKDIYYNCVVKNNYNEELLAAKKNGLVKKIGFSIHDEPSNLREIIEDAKIFEFVICQYNMLKRENEDVMLELAERGIEIMVMGPFGGGRYYIPDWMVKELECSTAAELSLKYVMANKGVGTILSGINDAKQVRENAETISADIDNFDKSRVDELVNLGHIISKYYCTGCNYCLPCPQQINISDVFKIANQYHVDPNCNDILPSSRINCKECRRCEQQCPQRLNIVDVIRSINCLISQVQE